MSAFGQSGHWKAASKRSPLGKLRSEQLVLFHSLEDERDVMRREVLSGGHAGVSCPGPCRPDQLFSLYAEDRDFRGHGLERVVTRRTRDGDVPVIGGVETSSVPEGHELVIPRLCVYTGHVRDENKIGPRIVDAPLEARLLGVGAAGEIAL